MAVACQPASSSEEILDLADKEKSKPIQIVETNPSKKSHHPHGILLPAENIPNRLQGREMWRHQSVLGFILAGINHVSFHIYWRIT